MGFFIDAMQKGGPFMWPILGCAIFGAAISAERIYYIFFRAYINGFSKNVDDIIEHFNYRATIGQMVKNAADVNHDGKVDRPHRGGHV